MTPTPDVPSERLEDAVSYLRYVADGLDPEGRVQLLLDGYDERGLAVERLTNEVDVLTEYHAAEIERLRGALEDQQGLTLDAEQRIRHMQKEIDRLREQRDGHSARARGLLDDRDAYVRRLARCREVQDQLRADLAARLAEVEAENVELAVRLEALQPYKTAASYWLNNYDDLLDKYHALRREVEDADADVREEYRITGDPGLGYPPYEYRATTPEEMEQFKRLLAEPSAFRRNVADIVVERRTVTTTPWVAVPPTAEPEDGEGT